MGLSTHVLDQVAGLPAVDVTVQLFINGILACEAKTDSDGRCKTLRKDGELTIGSHRLIFHIGDYFSRRNALVDQAPFFNVAIIEFEITDADRHYHVPLLASPFGYTTYRGS